MYGSVTTPSDQCVHITKLYSEVVVTESLSGMRKRVRGSVYTNGGRTALRVNSVFILELVWNCCTSLYPSLSHSPPSNISSLPPPILRSLLLVLKPRQLKAALLLSGLLEDHRKRNCFLLSTDTTRAMCVTRSIQW